MEIIKKIPPKTGAETDSPLAGRTERTYVFYKVTYNHHRDVSRSTLQEVRDYYEPAECECVLCLPESYRADGEETQLVICCHGAGGRVLEAENQIGGVKYASRCVDEGFAVLDVNGSNEHGFTQGCPAHVFALHRAYLYAVKHYNLSRRVLVAGASMGGQTAMNYVNTYPGEVLAAGLIYPRLNAESFTTADGHFCVGVWDRVDKIRVGMNCRHHLACNYDFPNRDEWCEENILGFNPYRTRSFINSDGERVVIPPCPIKIWHGLEDPTIDHVVSDEFVKSVRRGGCYIEYRQIEGWGHKMSPVIREELMLWFDRFR